MFSVLTTNTTTKKTLLLDFLRTLFKGSLQTVYDSNLARGLAIHTRFDELDLISRSQKLQFVFRFLSTLVLWRMVATHIKKIKYRSMLCVTDVYFRDITNIFFFVVVILHVNESRLSVCSSGYFCMHSREIIDIFPRLKKTNLILAFFSEHQ